MTCLLYPPANMRFFSTEQIPYPQTIQAFPTMNTKKYHRSPFIRTSSAALSLLLLIVGTSARAQTTTAWNGSSNSTWSTAGNWAGSVLPSSTVSALFNSTFSNQPQLTSNQATQGIWLATGVGQDVTIGKDGSARTLTITGNATLNGQFNAGILLDDSGNHSLTLGDASAGNYIINTTTSTGFYVNNAGTLTLTGLSNLGIGNGNTLTLGGNNTSGKIVISKGIAASTGAIVVNTAGSVTINNQTSYTGGTTLTAGTLNIGNAKALGNVSPGTFTINGGTIDNTSGGNLTIGNNLPISIGGDFAFKGTNNLNMGTGAVDLTGGTRTITTTAGTLTIATTISNGGLSKAGAGTLALSGNNTYASATTVSAGTLLISAGGSINSSANITVSSGATIQNANGASVTPALTLTEGAAVLTSAASSSFAPTSLTLSGNLSDGWTAISLTATLGSGLVKSGSLTLTLTGITAGTYNLTSGSGFSGSFASANVNGNALTISGSDFSGTNIGGYDYAYTNSTNVLQVTAVPEPATWALLAFSLTTVVVLRRRRHS